MRLIPWYENIPQSKTYPQLKNLLTRIFLAALCCYLGHSIPNLGQLLNFQGALTGTLITFIFPIAGFLKVFGVKELSNYEKFLCIGTLIYGVIGGSIASIFALNELI